MHMAQKVILWWKERCLLAMLVTDTQTINSQTSLTRTAILTRDTAVFLLRSLPGNLVDDVGDGVYSQAFVGCPGSQALWYGLSLRIGQFTFLVDDVGDGVYSQSFVDCPCSQALWYGLSLRIGQFTFFRSGAVPLPHNLLILHCC
jgi:hypothetical protein